MEDGWKLEAASLIFAVLLVGIFIGGCTEKMIDYLLETEKSPAYSDQREE